MRNLATRPDSFSPGRILLVRPSALGDVSRTVPALVTLRQAYPDAQIDWLVAESFVDVVREHPMLDDVVVFPRQALSRFGLNLSATKRGLQFARQLKRSGYDRVYDLQGLLRSGLFSFLTGARRRVGFADAREMGWLGYNIRHRVSAGAHTVDRMLGLLKADGLEISHDMRLYTSEKDQAWHAQFSEENSLSASGNICLAPTAKWLCKCWPIERWIDLGKKLLEHPAGPDKLIVLAAPGEREQVQPLLDALGPGQIVCPPTTVGQLMAIISHCRLLVCNDSAPLHIAVGFDKPVVAIFGPTDPAKVGPYKRENSVVRPPGATGAAALDKSYRRHDDQSLISQITLEEVWDKVALYL